MTTLETVLCSIDKLTEAERELVKDKLEAGPRSCMAARRSPS